MFDIEEFVAECETALAEPQPVLVIKELVERAVAQPAELDAALGTAHKGGFRCLHRSPAMTVLQFVWPPRVKLFPHDHRMWAANGIYGGGEDNTFYRRMPEGLQASGGRQLHAGDVALLGEDVIHAVLRIPTARTPRPFMSMEATTSPRRAANGIPRRCESSPLMSTQCVACSTKQTARHNRAGASNAPNDTTEPRRFGTT